MAWPFDTAQVQEAIKLAPEPKTPFNSQLVNRTKDFGTLSVLIDVKKEVERLATFSDPESQGIRVDKPGYVTYQLTPPYVKEYRPFGVRDLLSRFPGQSLEAMPQDAVLEEIAEVVVYLMNAVIRRHEWILSNFYQDGSVTVSGPDIPTFTLDLSIKATHQVTLTGNDVWGGSTVDIPANWDTWTDLVLADSGGKMVDRAYFGVKAARLFMADTEIKALADNRRYELLRVMHEKQPDNSIKFCIFKGVDCYIHPVKYDLSGTATNFWPENKVLLCSTAARVTKYFGAILDFDKILQKFRVVNHRYFVKDITANYNGTLDIMMQSNSIPVPEEPDSFLCATVSA